MKRMTYAVAAMMVLLIALIYGSLFLTAAGEDDREGWTDYIERVCEDRKICPELVEALIERESSWDPDAQNGTCIGLMQIDQVYHWERMQRLGVTDLRDPYENILIGVDFLGELFQEYEDPAAVLMYYNAGHSDRYGLGAWQDGDLSRYADQILERAAELERIHGK